MKRKYNIIIVTILVIMLFFVKEPIFIRLKCKSIENDIKRFLNFKSNKNIGKASIEEMKYYKSNINEYDISPLIEAYIKLIDEIINIKNNNKEFNGIGKINYDIDGYNSIGIVLFNDLIVNESDKNKSIDLLYSRINNRDFLNDNSDIKNEIIKQLEQKIIHKSNKIYEDWYILSDIKMIIELPFNCYIEYVPSDRRNINNYKKIHRVKITTNYHNYDKKNVVYPVDDCCEISLLNYNDEIKIATSSFGLTSDGKYNLRLKNFLFIETNQATAILKSHDIDEYHEQGNSKFRWRMISTNDLTDIDENIKNYIYNLYDVEHRPYKEIEVIINKILDIYNESKEEGLSKVEIDKKIFNGLGLTISKDNLYAQWHTLTSIAWIGSNAENDDVKIILSLSEPYEDMYFKFSEIIEEIKKMKDDGVSLKDILLYAYDEIRKEYNMLLAWLPRSALE